MAENRNDEAGTTGSPNTTERPDEAVPMVGEYRIDYSPLTREELDAVCHETEALLARSKLIRESDEL